MSKKRPMSVRKKFVFLLLTCLLVMTFLGVSLEIWSRVTHRYWGRHHPHPRFNHVFAPNYTIEMKPHKDLEPYIFQTNSMNARSDREYDIPKPSGTYRIMHVGDSFVEGYRLDKTIPKQLEAALSSEFSAAGKKLELINAGTGSYSPMLHYFALEQKLLSLEPDFIILSIDMTDAFDDAIRYRDLLTVSKAGKPTGVQAAQVLRLEAFRDSLSSTLPASNADAWLAWGAGYSWFVHGAFKKRANVLLKRYPKHVPSSIPNLRGKPLYDWQHPETKASIKYSQTWIVKIFDLLKARGIKFCLSTYPHLPVLTTPRFANYLDSYKALAKREGVLYHDATPAFKASKENPAEFYLSKDIHFNYKGQTLWAESLRAFLRDLNLPKN